MPSNTVLGKRKAQGDQTETILVVRCIIECHWATNPVDILASDALTLLDLFSTVQQAIPVLKRHSILGQTFAAPFFFLQDKGMHELLYDDRRGYGVWLNVNVKSGLYTSRRIEIHLRTDAAALQFQIDRQTEGEQAAWTRADYVPLNTTPVKAAKDHEWKVAEADGDDLVEEEMREKLVEAPSTEEWMAVTGEVVDAAKKRVKTAPAPAPPPAAPAAEKEAAVEAFEITTEPEGPAEPEDDFWKEYELDLTLSPATEAKIKAEEAERKRRGL